MSAKGLRLVVTGGIGSGKSTVMELLRQRGFRVVDADRLAHEVLEPGGPGFDAVAERWPTVVSDGRIDRAALAQIVFSDGEALRELEGLVHPHVRRRIVEADRDAGPEPLAVEISVPKVLPEGWTIVVVDVPEDERIARVIERGADPEDARRRVSNQPSDDEWRSLATVLLPNDADVETLRARLDAILETLDPAPVE